MADNDLVSENAQLRRELEGFRRQQVGVVHPAIAQNENAAAQQWNAADLEIKRLEKQHSELLSEGKFEESAALQKTIAAMANRQEYARQQWASWNGLKAASPVDQWLAANAGQYTAEEQQWIREHPDYVTDPQFNKAILDAHNEALSDGYQRGSPAYFARMNRRAAEHGGGGAGRGEPPMLVGDSLDIARSSYTAVHPDRQTASPAEISKWWHEMSHSPAAHRIRESMAGSSYQTFRSRW
jgi:hypothetical protein